MSEVFEPTQERVDIALDAVYQSEAIIDALKSRAKDYNPTALPWLLVSMCKRLGDLNGVIMSALGDEVTTIPEMRNILGDV